MMTQQEIEFSAKCNKSFHRCESAASFGTLEALKEARKDGCPWGDTCAKAALRGCKVTLEWARQEGCPWDSKTRSNAETYLHYHYNKSGIALLDWLDEKNCPADWSEKRCHKLSFPCESAAIQGKLEDLKQARSVGFRWGNTYMWAAYCGHLEVLRWASENGCPWDAQARI